MSFVFMRSSSSPLTDVSCWPGIIRQIVIKLLRVLGIGYFSKGLNAVSVQKSVLKPIEVFTQWSSKGMFSDDRIFILWQRTAAHSFCHCLWECWASVFIHTFTSPLISTFYVPGIGAIKWMRHGLYSQGIHSLVDAFSLIVQLILKSPKVKK